MPPDSIFLQMLQQSLQPHVQESPALLSFILRFYNTALSSHLTSILTGFSPVRLQLLASG